MTLKILYTIKEVLPEVNLKFHTLKEVENQDSRQCPASCPTRPQHWHCPMRKLKRLSKLCNALMHCILQKRKKDIIFHFACKLSGDIDIRGVSCIYHILVY